MHWGAQLLLLPKTLVAFSSTIGELKEEDVKVYFFENNGIETKTYKLQFKKTGEIVGAPDSFFETYEDDVLNIALQD